MNIIIILIVCILTLLVNAENATKTKRAWIDPWSLPLPPPYALRPHLRSGLSTWWAAPWADRPLVPGPALINGPVLHDGPHLIDPPIPFVPIRLAPQFLHGVHEHTAKYIAANLGSIHIAPLLGHTEDVIATNLELAPGRSWL